MAATNSQDDALDALVGKTHVKSQPSHTDKDENDAKPKTEYLVYKYSDNKRCTLHESIILAGSPVFIKYENNEIKAVPKIYENSRTIRPPAKEECPYQQYEFADLREVQKYIDRANNETFDSLYSKAKSIVLKYNDQDDPIITGLAADIVWSYYQDLFATTHYVSITGDNETGKSTIGHTFQHTGYRAVKATSVSAANYYRTLGFIEPGQCTIVEDEADNIEEEPDKMKILKAGYSYNEKVPKVNMNSFSQKQNWFYAYGFKMIISEKRLDAKKGKGLRERSFEYHCKQSFNNIASIKEVTINPVGDSVKQNLYHELVDFRKLLLCHRLIHHRDHIPDIDTGLTNRDKELGGPLLQLFHATKAFAEIKYSVEEFLAQRKERKGKTVESEVLQPLIAKLLSSNKSTEIYLEQIWDTLRNTVPGKYNPSKPDEYQTNDYGALYRNTISQKIVDKFGAVRKRKNNGTVLIFDEQKIRQFEVMSGDRDNADSQSKPEITCNYTLATNKPDLEQKNTLEDESEGSVSSEGSTVCGFIIV